MTADAPADTGSPPDDPCPPCRGTGEVISNLGGEPKTVKCPWCEGTGRWTPQHDAQARYRDQTQE
jgi:DnaJ-class molecular chaperone